MNEPAAYAGRPTLVVVSGPAGSGKTTLAHRLAALIGCPAICRDEIKEGMVHANPGFRAAASDPLSLRTLPTFFGVLDLLLRAGVTTVAEAAFQDRLWRPGLEPLRRLAELRLIRCTVAPDIAASRMSERLATDARRAAHADSGHLAAPPAFVPVSLDAPALEVDTSDGYRPGLAEITAFVNRSFS